LFAVASDFTTFFTLHHLVDPHLSFTIDRAGFFIIKSKMYGKTNKCKRLDRMCSMHKHAKELKCSEGHMVTTALNLMHGKN
jgi:hypothetical protein